MRLADDAGLSGDTRLSRRLGFTGRTIIHPRQARPVSLQSDMVSR
jgi:citrate lyase beta subunit